MPPLAVLVALYLPLPPISLKTLSYSLPSPHLNYQSSELLVFILIELSLAFNTADRIQLSLNAFLPLSSEAPWILVFAFLLDSYTVSGCILLSGAYNSKPLATSTTSCWVDFYTCYPAGVANSSRTKVDSWVYSKPPLFLCTLSFPCLLLPASNYSPRSLPFTFNLFFHYFFQTLTISCLLQLSSLAFPPSRNPGLQSIPHGAAPMGLLNPFLFFFS